MSCWLSSFLATEPETSQDKQIVTGILGGIELNHVSFRYSEESPYILDDLSLSIQPGEYVAVVRFTMSKAVRLM